MKDKQKYFFVPIQLLRGLADDPRETSLKCAYYGVYSLTQTKKVTNKEERTFVEQFVYAYYNEPDTLTMELSEKMEEAIDEGMFHADADHKGFRAGKGRKLNVDSEIHELERIFEDDKEFKNMVIKFGKARDAYQFYGMKKGFKDIFDWAMEMEKQIPPKSPMVMIGQDKLREFYSEEKTELEIMTFAVYLAIRSILGTKKFCRTTKEMILARAFGFRNMEELAKNPPALFEKYSNRYWIDKVLSEVSGGGWNIHVYSTKKGLRGLYIGAGISADEFENYVAEMMKAKDSKHRKKVMNKRIEEKIEKLKNDDLNDLV
jgi:hypothetical protein